MNNLYFPDSMLSLMPVMPDQWDEDEEPFNSYGVSYFNPPVSVRLYEAAKDHYFFHGRALANVAGTQRYVWKFTPELVNIIFEFVSSPDLISNVAYGTVTHKNPDGSQWVMPKVRNSSNFMMSARCTL